MAGADHCRSLPLAANFGLEAKLAAAYRVEVFFPASKRTAQGKDVQPGQQIEGAEPEAP